MTTTQDFQLEAIEALAKCGGSMTIKLSNTKSPQWEDKFSANRNHYRVTLKSKLGSYTFNYWDSIANFKSGEQPSVYDVLACLDYYISDKFEDFCNEAGYDTDSIKARKTWKACLKQSKKLHELFPHDSQKELLSSIR